MIIPAVGRSDAVLRTRHEDDGLFFGEADIINPAPMVQRALECFDRAGKDGVPRRHGYALVQHNFPSRLKAMLDIAEELLRLARTD